MPARRTTLLALSLLGGFLLTPAVHAQSTEADIKTHLADKPLYLRGCWDKDKLHFDAAGKLLDKAHYLTITLCGFDLTSVQLDSKKLVLKGRRVGLMFDGDTQKPVTLDEPLRVEVNASPSGDYGPALDAIFSYDLADMVPTLPVYWQSYAQKHFAKTASQVAPTNATAGMPVKFDVTKPNGITAPKPIKTVAPGFNDYVRKFKFSGTALVHCWVERDGTPSHLSIVRALGLGLDESALAAVQQ